MKIRFIIACLLSAAYCAPGLSAAAAAGEGAVQVSTSLIGRVRQLFCFKPLPLPLHAAVDAKNAQAVKSLLEQGANPNACDSRGHSPLQRACAQWEMAGKQSLPLNVGYEELPDIFVALIQHGASLEADAKRGDGKAPDKIGTTMLPLHHSAPQFEQHRAFYTPARIALLRELNPMSTLISRGLTAKRVCGNQRLAQIILSTGYALKDLARLIAEYAYSLNDYETQLLAQIPIYQRAYAAQENMLLAAEKAQKK